jgi:uncharacterized phage protein gp47/JayE
MVVRTRTTKQIADEMMVTQRVLNPQLKGYGPFRVLGQINESMAVQIQKLERLIYTMNSNLSIRTATGRHLDALVIDRLPEGRSLGTYSTGFVVFGLTDPVSENVTIPEGTRLSRPVQDGEPVIFETAETTTIPAGDLQAVCGIRCMERGQRGNVPEYSIVSVVDRIDPLITIVENPLQTSGGADPETDDELRRRYIWKVLVPGRATIPTLSENLAAEEGVSEVGIDNVGQGDLNIIIDSDVGLYGDHEPLSAAIDENVSAGVTARGTKLAEARGSGSHLLGLGTSAGGKLFVRPLDYTTGPDAIELTYIDVLGRYRTGTVTVPALTRRGEGVAVDMESDDDRAGSVSAISYSGDTDYEVFAGLGTWPRLFVLPKHIPVSVFVRLKLHSFAPNDLVTSMENSIRAYLGSYRIGEDIEYSDVLVRCVAVDARETTRDRDVAGMPFEGIDELVSVVVGAKFETASQLGQKIVFDPDERVGSVAVSIEVV